MIRQEIFLKSVNLNNTCSSKASSVLFQERRTLLMIYEKLATPLSSLTVIPTVCCQSHLARNIYQQMQCFLLFNIMLTTMLAATTSFAYHGFSLSDAKHTASMYCRGCNEAREIECYKGDLLGVYAKVRLHTQRTIAYVQLYGIPLGGTISGEAWIDTNGSIVFQQGLSRALSRRFVRINSAIRNQHRSKVFVEVNLPIVGKRVITLHREQN